MAIDVKSIIADSLLELCKEKPLKKISISDILNKSKISRQSFYNHFRDKEDLIRYIYMERIIFPWKSADPNLEYSSVLLGVFQRYEQYHSFMKQALLLDGQNNLRDFMTEYCTEIDMQWHQLHYGNRPMPEALKIATKYHAIATMGLTISWILSDMPSSPQEISSSIALLRNMGLSFMLDNNPYSKGD